MVVASPARVGPPVGTPRRATGGRPRGRLAPALFLSPLVVLLVVWIYGPAVFTFVLSFSSWSLVGDNQFVALENYRSLFARTEFPQSVWQTLAYSALLLPFATVVPMALAIMLWQRVSKFSQGYRVVLFVPMMVAPVAHATSWSFILQPLTGLATKVAEVFGGTAPNWLGNQSTALVTIVMITSAKLIAQNLLLYTAALAPITRNTLQAARIEGATWFDITRHVVEPQLRPVTLLLGALSFITAGQWVFNNISVLTQGGPAYATDNIFYTIYRLGFTFFETGQASAAAVLLVVVVVLLSLPLLKLQTKAGGR
ncbi:carbohydrate ABC transporter permease [Propionibacteriaceae bacterium G1746]|uniref:carbohydrate ABC transporter permease n=1 Tax=Aestuariimicrobium sp. G57 TaxID=3418485 RepID=UPI003C2085B1